MRPTPRAPASARLGARLLAASLLLLAQCAARTPSIETAGGGCGYSTALVPPAVRELEPGYVGRATLVHSELQVLEARAVGTDLLVTGLTTTGHPPRWAGASVGAGAGEGAVTLAAVAAAPDGALRWTWTPPAGEYIGWGAADTSPEETVVARSGAGGVKVTRLTASGATRFEASLPEQVTGRPWVRALASTTEVALVSVSDAELHVITLDAGGAVVGRRSLGPALHVSAFTWGSTGFFMAEQAPPSGTKITSFDERGGARWQTSSPDVAERLIALPDGGVVSVGAGVVTAYRGDGTSRWRVAAGAPLALSVGPSGRAWVLVGGDARGGPLLPETREPHLVGTSTDGAFVGQLDLTDATITWVAELVGGSVSPVAVVELDHAVVGLVDLASRVGHPHCGLPPPDLALFAVARPTQ